MSIATLPVVFANAGRVTEASAETPLIVALKAEFATGLNLQAALEKLMGLAGLLGAPAAPTLPSAAIPVEVRAALERLQRAGIIIVDAGGRSIRLTALRDLAQPIALPLTVKPGTEVKRGDVGLSVGGEASLLLESSVLHAPQAAELGLGMTGSDVLHRLRIRGQLGAHLGLDAGTGAASAGVGASTDFAAGIHWYFQRHADDTVVSSLVDAAMEIAHGAQPWDLDDAIRVLDEPRTPSGHLDALKAIDVEADRKLSFRGSIALARGFATQVDVPAPDGRASLAIAAKAGVSLAYRVQQAGSWRIRLTREQGDTVLSLTRAHGREQVREFKLGVDVGVSGVGDLVQAWVDELLPMLDPDIKAAFEEWSRPGTALRERLLRRIASDEGARSSLAQLAELLLGQGDAAATAQSLSDALLDGWQSELDERVQAAGQRAEALANQLLAPLTAKVGGELGGEVVGTVQKLLLGALDEVQQDVEAKLGTLRDKLIRRAQAQLALALQPLEQVGERVDQLVRDVDANATRIADALKRLFARYENLRKTLHKAASDAGALKVALAVTDTARFESGERSALQLRFRVANATTRALFRRLVLGQGDIDCAEIERIAGATDGALLIDSCSFAAFAARARSTTLSLDLFGLRFADARVLRDDVRIEIDSSGRVGVFAASAGQSHTSTTLKESRVARFSADFDLIDPTPGRLPGTLGLSFELSDDDLKPKELRQFFDSFEDAGLLRAEVAVRAQNLLGGPARNVQIEVGLSGIESALRSAASVGDAALRRRAFDNLMAFARPSAAFADSVLGAMWKADAERLFQWASDAATPVGARRAAVQALAQHGVAQSSGHDRALALRLQMLNQRMSALSAVVAALAQIRGLAQSAADVDVDNDRARQLRDELDRILQTVQRAMQPLVAVNDAVMGLFSERLPDRVVALLATLTQLADPGAVTARPMLRWFTLSASGERQLGPPTLLG